MSKKTVLASFGIRALEVLRAVVANASLGPATIEKLTSIGWATRSPDGNVALTVAGREAHELLEKLDSIPENQVELFELISGPATAEEAADRADSPKPARSSLYPAP